MSDTPYGNVVDAKSYLAARGKDASVASNITGEDLLVASDYVDNRFGLKFSGTPTGDRAWPREGAKDYYGRDVNGTPQPIINAVYEVAYVVEESPSSLATPVTPASVMKSFQAGPIKVSYAVGSGDVLEDGQVQLPVVVGLLRPYFTPLGLPVVLVS